MCQSSKIVAIIVLLNLFQLHNINAAVKSSSNLYSYPHRKLHYEIRSFEEKTFVYAACDKSDHRVTEKPCTIIQRKFPYNEVAYSCNVTLQNKYKGNHYLSRSVFVQPFGQENAILTWGEEGPNPKFYIMIIQLMSCENKIIELDDPEQSIYTQQTITSTIVTYDNNFDVFIKDLKLKDLKMNVTGTPIGVNVGFDRETQLIYHNVTKNLENSTFIGFISSIAKKSPNKGFVYNPVNFVNNTVVLVKPDGSEQLLVEEKGERIINAENDMISVCQTSRDGSHVTCIQYDENGEVKFKVTLDHDDTKGVVPDDLYIIPAGGLIIKAMAFLKSDERIDSYKPISCVILRINSKGKLVGRISLDNLFKAYAFGHAHIFKNGDEYCAVTPIEDPQDNIRIYTDCFTENDFSM